MYFYVMEEEVVILPTQEEIENLFSKVLETSASPKDLELLNIRIGDIERYATDNFLTFDQESDVFRKNCKWICDSRNRFESDYRAFGWIGNTREEFFKKATKNRRHY